MPVLADLGANVIKIEPPLGDGYRNIRLFYLIMPPRSQKRLVLPILSSLCLSESEQEECVPRSKKDDHKEIFLKLCDKADAIIENMRAGVMERLGLGFETISGRNEQIVYACVRGFGDPRTGESPYAHWPSLDAAAQALVDWYMPMMDW